jgi:hypothetical protein
VTPATPAANGIGPALTVALGLALVATVAAAALTLLPACAVRLPWRAVVDTCPPRPGPGAAVLAAEAAEAERLALTREVQALERAIASIRCAVVAPVPEPAPEPLPEPVPEPRQAEVAPAPPPTPAPPRTESGIDRERFENRDLAAMEGCWELVTRYDVRDRRTGRVTSFRNWRICLDANGRGSETMRSVNGVQCRGPVTASFGRDGGFVIREPANLPCNNGTEIYRRVITCRLDRAGRANCDSFQPEINGRGAATLRRSVARP